MRALAAMRIVAHASPPLRALPRLHTHHQSLPVPLPRTLVPSSLRSYARAAPSDSLAEVYKVPADFELPDAEEFILRAKEHGIDPQAAHKYWGCADGYLKAMRRGGPSWERFFIRETRTPLQTLHEAAIYLQFISPANTTSTLHLTARMLTTCTTQGHTPSLLSLLSLHIPGPLPVHKSILTPLITRLERLITGPNQDPNAMVLKARFLVAQGDSNDQAVSLLDRALEKPDFEWRATALLTRAKAQLQMGVPWEDITPGLRIAAKEYDSLEAKTLLGEDLDGDAKASESIGLAGISEDDVVDPRVRLALGGVGSACHELAIESMDRAVEAAERRDKASFVRNKTLAEEWMKLAEWTPKKRMARVSK